MLNANDAAGAAAAVLINHNCCSLAGKVGKQDDDDVQIDLSIERSRSFISDLSILLLGVRGIFVESNITIELDFTSLKRQIDLKQHQFMMI